MIRAAQIPTSGGLGPVAITHPLAGETSLEGPRSCKPLQTGKASPECMLLGRSAQCSAWGAGSHGPQPIAGSGCKFSSPRVPCPARPSASQERRSPPLLFPPPMLPILAATQPWLSAHTHGSCISWQLSPPLARERKRLMHFSTQHPHLLS